MRSVSAVSAFERADRGAPAPRIEAAARDAERLDIVAMENMAWFAVMSS